ncbi:hypothetical protein A3715_18150 [Oleiphilus sp. HI0009]|nr:hypothetical protein A3715_18150 [Oleiphilus sp. HI0009]
MDPVFSIRNKRIQVAAQIIRIRNSVSDPVIRRNLIDSIDRPPRINIVYLRKLKSRYQAALNAFEAISGFDDQVAKYARLLASVDAEIRRFSR